MTGETFQLGRMFMERLPHQGDLLRTLNAFCSDAHISFARANGQTLSNHLTEGTVLFAGELVLREILGPDRLRRKDGVTGLNLWV